MADNLHCYFCGKKATVHFTQIINNKILKMDLCEECAQKQGLADEPVLSLSDLLNKTDLFNEQEEEELVCSHCGFSPSNPQFQKSGRLGCPHCYETFSGMLKAILRDLNQNRQHAGKAPQHKADRQALRQKMTELERQMQDQIGQENYENAANLRDQIAEIKKFLEEKASPEDNEK